MKLLVTRKNPFRIAISTEIWYRKRKKTKIEIEKNTTLVHSSKIYFKQFKLLILEKKEEKISHSHNRTSNKGAIQSKSINPF